MVEGLPFCSFLLSSPTDNATLEWLCGFLVLLMKFDRLGRVVLCILVTSPNWVPVWSMFPAGWGKVPLFLFDMMALLAVFLLSVRHEGVSKGIPSSVAPKKWMTVGLLFFLFAYFLAGAFGVYWQKSLWGEQARQNGFLLLTHLVLFALLLGYFFRTRVQWRQFDRFLVWSAVLPAATVLLEALVPAVRDAFGEHDRYAAWFGNFLFLGSYLSLATFAGLRLFFSTRRTERWLTAAAVALSAIGVFLTGSRGPALGLIGGAVMTAFVWACFQKRRVAIAMVATVGALGMLLFALINTGNSDVLPVSLRRVLDVQAYARQNVPRLLHWNIAWKGFLARPLTGWGPENYQTIFDRYYEPELLRYSFYETVSDKPHNLWLETLGTGGILLGAALLSLLATCVWSILFLIRHHRISVLEGATLMGALAAYAVQSTFLFDTLPVSLLLFAIYGYVRSSPSAEGGSAELAPATSTGKRFSFPAVPQTTRFAVALCGVLVLAGADVYAGGFGLIASNATLVATDPAALSANAVPEVAFGRAIWFPNPYQEEMRKYVATSIVNREASGLLSPLFITQHVDTLRAAAAQSAARAPNDFLVQFVYGQVLVLAGESAGSAELFEQARVVFEKTGQLSPRRQAVVVQVAKALLLGERPGEAVQQLRALVAMDASIADPHWYLGLALSASGDDTGAAEEMRQAFTLGRVPATVEETQFLIDLFAEAEQFEDIVLLYKLLIDREPQRAVWHARLAATYATLGKAELAVIEAQRATALDPAFAAEAEWFTEQLLQQ